jgi:hypothetical protein
MAHLPAQDLVIKLCRDGMCAGDLPKTLAELLKLVSYNHAPFYINTWGLVLGIEPVWYLQVALYEKHSSFGVLVIHQSYHATLSATFNDEIQDAAHQALRALQRNPSN